MPDEHHFQCKAVAGALQPAHQRHYCRQLDLARLLPILQFDSASAEPAATRSIVAKLQRALRAERRKGLAGHWNYDLGHHAALLKAYRVETAALSAMRPIVLDATDRDRSTAKLTSYPSR